MSSNNTILIGGVVIITFGAVSALYNSKPETPVFIGGIGFILLASLIDMFGGEWSKLASGLVGLSVVTVILVEGPSLFAAIQGMKPPVSTTTGTETGGGAK